MLPRYRSSKPVRAPISVGTNVMSLLPSHRTSKPVRAASSVGTDVRSLPSRARNVKPVRAASSVGTEMMAFGPRSRCVKPVRAPSSVGTNVMALVRRPRFVSGGPSSPRLGGSAPATPTLYPLTYVGSCTPSTVAQSTVRSPIWQYAADARSAHGTSACRSCDRAASSCRAVQAHGLSPKAERSAHSAETAVPPGQVLPAAQAVSA